MVRSLVFLLAFWPALAPVLAGEHTVHVVASVDGRSSLVFRGKDMRWHHYGDQPPGGVDQSGKRSQQPTVVNGTGWRPLWREDRTSNAFFMDFSLPADVSGVEVRVEAVKARSPVEVKKGDGQFEVAFNDILGGADTYDVKIHLKLPAEGGAAPATPTAKSGDPSRSKRYIAVEADRQAKAIAARRLAADAVALEAVRREGAALEASLRTLTQQGQLLQRQLAAAEDALEDAQGDFDRYNALGDQRSDGRYFTRRALILVENAQEELQKCTADRDTIKGLLAARTREYQTAERALETATGNYQMLSAQYQQKFAPIYQEEYARIAGDLQQRVGASEEQAAAAAGGAPGDVAGTAAAAGEYSWIEDGKEMGRVLLQADGSVKGPAAENGADDSWEADGGGLRVRVGGCRWAFQPATPGMLLGKCTEGPEEVMGRKAVLRLVGGLDDRAADSQAPWEPPAGLSEDVRARLTGPVTYECADKTVTQIAVVLAGQAGLRYDAVQSQANVGALGAARVATFQVAGEPCGKALRDLLARQGLSFRVEGESIVLQR